MKTEANVGNGVQSEGKPETRDRAPADWAWAPRTVAVWQEWSFGKWRAFKTTFHGKWHLSDGSGVVFSDPYLQEVMGKAHELDERAALPTLPTRLTPRAGGA